MLTNPRYQIIRTQPWNIVMPDDQVDQNEYSDTAEIELGDGIHPESGEILAINLYTFEVGTGAVQTPAGKLLLFYFMDPDIDAGDTAIPMIGTWGILLGRASVAAADWISDANGAHACILDNPIPFHNIQTIWAVWFHEDATSFNDGAGDDEYLSFSLTYRRDT